MSGNLLTAIAKDKGVKPETLIQAARQIAYHESAGTMDPTIHQMSGGPGRGLFQYEIGENASAVSARNRLRKSYMRYKLDMPEWLKDLPDDFDPSELDVNQQFELFLGDHRERPKSDFTDLKNMPLDEWWGRYHQTENDPVKRAKFRADQKMLLQRSVSP